MKECFFLLEKNMKKVKLKVVAVILTIILGVNATYICVPVYALDDDGYYTLEDGTVIAEDEWDYWTRVLIYYGCQLGAIGKMDYSKFMQNNASFAKWWNINKSYWDGSENITITESQSLDLLEILKDYIQQHPDEVEKVNYQLFQTSTYEELFANYIDIKNAFSIYVPVNVPSELNSMENFETMLKSQNQEFPHLMCGMVFNTQIDQNRSQGYINQYFTEYQNYEQALTDSTKIPCIIGSWNADGSYRLGVYIYDNQTKSLTVDRAVSSTQQYHFVWSNESLNSGFFLTHNSKGLFTNSGNAYINMTDGYWNGWGNLPDATLYPELREKYKADFSGDMVKLPILGTPDGSVFRIFATEQDAMRYFETCANSGLNFDPNQVYTGGNVVINNNGDVYITNEAPGGDYEPGSDSSGILGVLQDIRDWVKKIYNQVVIGNVINAIDALADVLDTFKDYLDDAMGDVAAIGELGDELVTKFPFSLPQDILLVVTLFEAEPVAPVWEIPFRADFEDVGISIDESFIIDFTEFEDAVDVLKWFLSLIWVFGLAMLTPKVLGVGSIGNNKGD